MVLRVPPELRGQQVLLDRLVQRDQRDCREQPDPLAFRVPKVLLELLVLLGRAVLLVRKVLQVPREPLVLRVQRVPKGQLGLLVRQAQPDLAVQQALRVLKVARELPDLLVRLMPTNPLISFYRVKPHLPISLALSALMVVMVLARTLKPMLTALLALLMGKPLRLAIG